MKKWREEERQEWMTWRKEEGEERKGTMRDIVKLMKPCKVDVMIHNCANTDIQLQNVQTLCVITKVY